MTQRGGHIEVYFRPEAPIDTKVLASWIKAYEGRMQFIRSADGDGLAVDLGEERPLKWLADFILALVPQKAAGTKK
mgnify:CR=1 FL=1